MWNLRQGMTAGMGLAIFFTVLSTAQSAPEDRVATFGMTAIACAVALSLVFLVLHGLQSSRRR